MGRGGRAVRRGELAGRTSGVGEGEREEASEREEARPPPWHAPLDRSRGGRWAVGEGRGRFGDLFTV